MNTKLVSIAPVLLAGLALWIWQARRYAQNRHSAAAPAEVTTWEGEGGALHGSGSQLCPAPVHDDRR